MPKKKLHKTLLALLLVAGAALASGMNREDVRAFGIDRGWVDCKVCAVDDTWSGLCFSRSSP